MADDTHAPDFDRLLRSPYEPDPDEGRDEGGSDIPWVPAVLAAIAGALVAGAFVVFAVVAGPDDADEEATPTSTSPTTTVAAAPSDDLPEGFVAVTDRVGAKVVDVSTFSDATWVAVTTAVPGGVDPASVPPLDVAYWLLDAGGDSTVMRSQYGEMGVLGNRTVEFPPKATLEAASVTPYLAIQPMTETSTLDLALEVPQTVTDHRIRIGDTATIVVHELTIADTWGHVDWSVEGDTPAIVETIVTFAGTDDPGTDDVVDETLLTPEHLERIVFGSGVRAATPLFGFGESEQLVMSGQSIRGSNQPTAITAEFRVTVPSEVAASVPIDLPAGG